MLKKFHVFAVEIREIKEIKVGKQSKDFEKWPEDAKRMENLRCFVVYYGSEFKLKTLSISGKYVI
jgi:phosphatidylinositol phospholipase C gamma-1